MALLEDGFSTTITFPDILPGIVLILVEREVQAPELDIGGPIDVNTMRQVRYRMQAGKRLLSLGDVTVSVKWDPIVYVTVAGVMGVNTRLLVTFPDLQVLTLWCFIGKFTPPSMKEGDPPWAELKLHVSNRNRARAEAGPTVGGAGAALGIGAGAV